MAPAPGPLLARRVLKVVEELVLKLSVPMPAPKRISSADSVPARAGAAPGAAPMLIVPVPPATGASETIPPPTTTSDPPSTRFSVPVPPAPMDRSLYTDQEDVEPVTVAVPIPPGPVPIPPAAL
ncbi:hypothetical protein LMG6003_04672 [Achromobacter insolitus]|nr:hypothetical protein LMG6003_04672 [Achromobacter insolitus]